MIAGARPIPRLHRPSPDAFRVGYERPQRPVVITGALEGCVALETWSLQHLADAGRVPVRVRISKRGARQLFAGDTAEAFEFRSVPLREAIARIREPGDEIWYLQHCELPKVPTLHAEVGRIPYVPRKHRARSLLWACGTGTVNPLHWDTNHVVLAQITGEKRFVVFPPEDSSKLASFVDSTVWRTTALDLGAIDRTRFPEVDHARAWFCTLRAGDVLFIPYRFWHYMESEGDSISVSWWWSPSLRVHLRDTVRDRAAGLVQGALRAIKRRAGPFVGPTEA